ncbi:hypothetical protein LY76DRAFT_130276 [Colletotrichum caudatum]|nr:hypothetical protein LY76DRAFT_130276 [Colletotrichum caudatum]
MRKSKRRNTGLGPSLLLLLSKACEPNSPTLLPGPSHVCQSFSDPCRSGLRYHKTPGEYFGGRMGHCVLKRLDDRLAGATISGIVTHTYFGLAHTRRDLLNLQHNTRYWPSCVSSGFHIALILPCQGCFNNKNKIKMPTPQGD